jgi:hypothetical protein
VARVAAFGIAVEPPAGWEARLFALPGGEATLHAASFALPLHDGEYGGAATAAMAPDAAFIALTEFRADARLEPGAGLFAAPQPTTVDAEELSARAVQVGRRGHLGLQRFFTTAGRPLCLYVVLGSAGAVGPRLPQVRALLRTLAIDPRDGSAGDVEVRLHGGGDAAA